MNWPKNLGTKLMLLALIQWLVAYYGTIWHTQRHPREAIVWLHDTPKMRGWLSKGWNGDWVLRTEKGEVRFKDFIMISYMVEEFSDKPSDLRVHE